MKLEMTVIVVVWVLIGLGLVVGYDPAKSIAKRKEALWKDILHIFIWPAFIGLAIAQLNQLLENKIAAQTTTTKRSRKSATPASTPAPVPVVTTPAPAAAAPAPAPKARKYYPRQPKAQQQPLPNTP